MRMPRLTKPKQTADAEAPAARAPQAGAPLTSELTDSIRFNVSEPQGYYFTQVETFVEQVRASLAYWEHQEYLWRQREHALTVDLDHAAYDIQRLSGEIEVFRVNGSALVNPDGTYVTESQAATTQQLAAERDQAIESAIAWEAEAARLREALVAADAELDAMRQLNSHELATAPVAVAPEVAQAVTDDPDEVTDTLGQEPVSAEVAPVPDWDGVEQYPTEDAPLPDTLVTSWPVEPEEAPEDQPLVVASDQATEAEADDDLSWMGDLDLTLDEPAVEEPVVDEPAVEEPVVEEPAVEEPAVEEPAVEEPAVEEPAVEEPVVREHGGRFASELPEGVELPGTGEAAITYPPAAPDIPLDTHGVPVEMWAPELNPDLYSPADDDAARPGAEQDSK